MSKPGIWKENDDNEKKIIQILFKDKIRNEMNLQSVDLVCRRSDGR